jgi:hypothetical protein
MEVEEQPLNRQTVKPSNQPAQSSTADFAGLGRMALPYADYCADHLAGGKFDRRRICRTFGECTNAPRHGKVSGCYPLDAFYKTLEKERN